MLNFWLRTPSLSGSTGKTLEGPTALGISRLKSGAGRDLGGSERIERAWRGAPGIMAPNYRLSMSLLLQEREGDAFDRLSLYGETLSCQPDRKSTRLNSSHRCISYAVFCLKK